MTAVDPAVPVSKPGAKGAATPEVRDVEALRSVLGHAFWNPDNGGNWTRIAEHVLASEWLARRDAATADRARREGAVEAGERIAQAIDAEPLLSKAGHERRRALRIARADRLETP